MKKTLKKNANLPLNYIFIIFVSLIAVFVIVGMLSKWSLSSNKFMCKLTGDCNEELVLDKETIIVQGADSTRFFNEIVKQAKICFERSQKSENRGSLCYTVKCEGCTLECTPDMIDNIGYKDKAKLEPKADCTEFTNSDKAIIEFDYSNFQVIIK
ncbi:MAG: hypothetical protein KKF44_05330 [Nanoarchaeota archaeon]|nr:hypothetical protein [Nanoarchaeota archaeon]